MRDFCISKTQQENFLQVIATYALKVGSRKGGGMQKVVKRYASILSEGITARNVGSQIENINMKITNLKTNFQNYGMKESINQVSASTSNCRMMAPYIYSLQGRKPRAH